MHSKFIINLAVDIRCRRCNGTKRMDIFAQFLIFLSDGTEIP
jgi:hypothetical protein